MFWGVVCGLRGGLSPGPLLTLVVTETLRHGPKEGVKVSVAPLLTDPPIILGTLFALSRLSDILPALGAISLLGAVFLAYLGYESLSFKGVDIDSARVKPQSIRKGVAVNFLNPNPYVFWFSIGAPMLLKALNGGAALALLFIACFYAVLVGSKILVAVVVGRSRLFLKGNRYIYTIRSLGIALLIFSILFLKDGLRNLGVL